MARGRKTSLTIRLTSAERQTLLVWQQSTTLSAGRVRRGRIILLLADGVPISRIADAVGLSRHCVYKWVRRFLREGLAGLADKPRYGYWRGPHQRAMLQQPNVDVG
jgi:DNA invertase Pin-like site-specific DNA recombinase